MRNVLRSSSRIVLFGLVTGGLVITGVAASAAPSPRASAVVAAAKKPAPPPKVVPHKAPENFSPKSGVTYNNPLGNKTARRKNISLLLRAINSSPPGSTIRIATWNERSNEALAALRAAAKRGVSVRVTIDRGNDLAGTPTANPQYNKFKTYLSNLNKSVSNPAMKNWAKTCVSACRQHYVKGKKFSGGISHTKFYLFSQVGKAKDVVIYGSFNLTDLATGYQWNDLYTDVNPGPYNFMLGIFSDMQPEDSQAAPFRTGTFGNLTMDIFPNFGPGTTSDPVLTALNKIKCSKAGKVGTAGHTAIRIAQTAILGARGLRLADKLHSLHQQGCNIRLLYAVMGNDVLKAMRNPAHGGAVPFKQVVQDFNHDGIYDRYLHTKFMTVNGNYAGKSDQQVSWNGSSNWTGLSLASDETFGRIESDARANSYNVFVNYWWHHAPKGGGTSTSPGTDAHAGGGAGADYVTPVNITPANLATTTDLYGNINPNATAAQILAMEKSAQANADGFMLGQNRPISGSKLTVSPYAKVQIN